MEQAALYYCGNCESKKPWEQFKLHEKDDQYGRKGEPTSQCLHCTEKEWNRCQNKKRKCDKESLNPSVDPEEPEPILSFEQFTALLCELALGDELSCHTHVSTGGLAG